METATAHSFAATSVMALSLEVTVERWPIAGAFTIARGSRTEAVVVVAAVSDGKIVGRGECVPYERYGESVDGVVAAIEAMRGPLHDRLDRATLQSAMPAGAARNALDCALWDWEAKRSGRPAHLLAGLAAPGPVVTAYTISLGAPEMMAASAAKVADRALLKIKLGAPGDIERLQAVRAAAPRAALIVDANEGWNDRNIEANLAACADAGVVMVEQPLPAGADTALASVKRPAPVCADESLHDRASLQEVAGRYDAVNIKLDKAGGLTEALAVAAEAERLGLQVMVGCMLATSLAMAPAMLVAQRARVVDLDGPLLLARDRPHGLLYRGSEVHPPSPELWG